MTTVTVSREFQIVIPKAIRDALEIQAGQQVQVIQYHNRIVLIPIRPISHARGFLRGIDTAIDRSEDRV